jgi:hypothetical protein
MVTLLAFVVLGGTAWALAKNTVGPRQLKPNAVHTKDIDDDAVTSEKIKDGTLTAPCEAGERATGGGYRSPPPKATFPTSNATVIESRPDPETGTPNAWALQVQAGGGNSGSSPNPPRPPDPEVTAYAVCSS